MADLLSELERFEEEMKMLGATAAAEAPAASAHQPPPASAARPPDPPPPPQPAASAIAVAPSTAAAGAAAAAPRAPSAPPAAAPSWHGAVSWDHNGNPPPHLPNPYSQSPAAMHPHHLQPLPPNHMPQFAHLPYPAHAMPPQQHTHVQPLVPRPPPPAAAGGGAYGGGMGGVGGAGLKQQQQQQQQQGAEQQQQQQQQQQMKKKAIPRKAAGQTWVDPTLTDFPENDHRLFCGDLGNEVNDDVLAKAFSKYSSFNLARVIRDKASGKTKGYGFVSFNDPLDAAAALKEMNGRYVGNRPVKLRKSTWKERVDTEALKAKRRRGGTTQPQKKQRHVLHM